MPKAVLVVDMLRGFLEPGFELYCGDAARDIIPNVRRLIEDELSMGAKLLFICDNHAPDDLEFQMFPVHCVKGTREAEIIPDLAEYEGDIIYKNRYSAFFETDLEQRLSAFNPESVIVCGVCTDICVMHTVADARNRDYIVEVPENCVATFDLEAQSYALKHIKNILGAKVVSTSI